MATQQQAKVNQRLAAITEAGTSIWLDQISRSLIESGELERLTKEDCLRGVTSNPTIFNAAILGSDDYDEQLERLSRDGRTTREIYQELEITDIQNGCDVLRAVYDSTERYDGYVSLEVDPDLAFDTERTIKQAREYWQRVGRPNLMIKIPGSPEGVPAIEEMVYEGVNINVTLLFAVQAYEQVAEAYIRALERRQAEGKAIDMRSVASFFVSRVDTEVDKRLEALGRTDLRGRAGLANARAAYRRFEEIFHGERFAELKAAGASVQRPLWASTGVKDPAYPDTMYVDGLIGPETVNTMPMATLMAAADHAHVEGVAAEIDPDPDLRALAEAGIDLDDVTDKLLREGVEKFIEPFDKLFHAIDSRREAIFTSRPPTIEASIPDELEPRLAARVKDATSAEVARRIWRKDPTLWAPEGTPEVANRLGWLTVTDQLRETTDGLLAFAEEVRAEGTTDVVLLGMGGSSLAPEVLRRSFGDEHRKPGYPDLHVLDSTDAGAIRALEQAIDLERTVFIVSTKSGGTLETLSLFRYFWSRRSEGRAFVAITDAGSGLEQLAREHEFRRTFLNDPNIGGRYSALSYFGLVPAALMGADIVGILDRAGVAEQNCLNFDAANANSGQWLGLAFGELGLAGHDKLTYVINPPLESFGLWVEQLIAESLGKDGKGIVPVTDEPVGEPGAYGDDRTLVYLRHVESPSPETDAAVDRLAEAGLPVIKRSIHEATDLGRLFFFAEFAIAVAGSVLGVNPFNQPDVEAAKQETRKVLESDADDPPDADDDALRALVSGLAPPHYFGIHGYVQPSPAFDEAVAELRSTVRDATKTATTFGYGPRYLHSTGQLHKGGPPTGRFLQVIHDSADDLEIPDAPYTFNRLKHAQATGDLQTLRARGRSAERVTLTGNDPAAALRALTERIRGLL